MPEENNGCVFCDENVIKTKQIYQTKLSRVLLDHKPIVPGHCLIIPKRHVPSYSFLNPDESEEVSYLIKKVALALVRAYQGQGYNVLFNEGKVAGQTVPHFHIHIIPRQKSKHDLDPKEFLAYAETKRKVLSDKEAAEVKAKLEKAIY